MLDQALFGRIDLATRFGTVLVHLEWSTESILDGTRISVACGEKVGRFVAELAPEASRSINKQVVKRLKFHVPAAEIKSDDDVTLSVLYEDSAKVLATAKVREVDGAIISISRQGQFLGWATDGGAWPAVVEILIDGQRVSTCVADRYSSDLSCDRPVLVGFEANTPIEYLRLLRSNAVVELRCLPSGVSLFSARFKDLRVKNAVKESTVLPFDVIYSKDVEAIYDEHSINWFHEEFGTEALVETLYCYLLERRSDVGGLAHFTEVIRNDRNSIKTIMIDMYNSEERRRKGRFFGPFVNDSGYPFLNRNESDFNKVSAQALLDHPGPYVIVKSNPLESAEVEELPPPPEPVVMTPPPSQIVNHELNHEVAFLERFLTGSGGRAGVAHWLDYVKQRWLLSHARGAARRKQWRVAENFYSKLLNINPDQPKVWVQYGHVIKEQGEVDAAIGVYRHALKLDPSNHEIYQFLSDLMDRTT